MNKLEILKENAVAAYEKADDSQKQLLRDLWPGMFVQDPYLKACELLGISPKPPLTDRSDKDEVSLDAYHRLTICIRAKNMINGKLWEMSYDGSEYHYTPRFKKEVAGFGFSDANCVHWRTVTLVGSRLEYRTYELMIEGVAEFDEYYQDYYNY